MCENLDSLKKQLAEIMAGSTEENTGFTDSVIDDRYGARHGNSNERTKLTFIGNLKQSVGDISISGEANRGFGFSMSSNAFGPDRDTNLGRVRGLLVLVMATAVSDKAKAIATAYAKAVELLATQCFAVSGSNITIGKGDPEISFTMTNNVVEVDFQLQNCVPRAGVVQLDLGVPYLVSSGLADILAGKDNTSFRGSELEVLVDGKFQSVASMSRYASDERDEETLGVVTQEQLDGLIDVMVKADKVELTKRIVKEVLRNLAAHGEVVVHRARTSGYREGSLTIGITVGKHTYNLDVHGL